MTLTKADISDSLSNSLQLNRKDAQDLVEQLFEEIRESLEQGEPVKFSGFGNFELRHKESRPGRNPKTLAAAVISARRVVTFKASQKLKQQLQRETAADQPENDSINKPDDS